jgi:hypothetical protein
MIRRTVLIASVGALLLAPVTVSGAQVATGPPPPATMSAEQYGYTVTASAADVEALRRDHFDVTAFYGLVDDGVQVEIVMSEAEADGLRSRGLDVRLNPGIGESGVRRAALAAGGVFRPYGGDGGLAEEIVELSEQYPNITELEVIGQSGLGTDI